MKMKCKKVTFTEKNGSYQQEKETFQLAAVLSAIPRHERTPSLPLPCRRRSADFRVF